MWTNSVKKERQVFRVPLYLFMVSVSGSCWSIDRSGWGTGNAEWPCTGNISTHFKRDVIWLVCSFNTCSCSDNVWTRGPKLERICSNSWRSFPWTASAWGKASLAGSIVVRLYCNNWCSQTQVQISSQKEYFNPKDSKGQYPVNILNKPMRQGVYGFWL